MAKKIPKLFLKEEIVNLGKKLGYKHDKDWYNLNYELVENNLSNRVIVHFKWSPYRIAKFVVRNKSNFHEWLMKGQTPRGFWQNDDNLKRYFKWLKKKKNIKVFDDLYRLKSKDFNVQLLRRFNDRWINLLEYLYPKRKFYPWLFKQSNMNFWSSKKNQLEYLAWLEKKLKIKKNEDWYKFETSIFKIYKGQGLLQAYNSSLFTILKNLRPDFEWLPWLFKIKFRNYGKLKSERLEYIKWFEKKFKIKKESDWYKFHSRHIIKNNGLFVLEYYKPQSIKKVLKELYPDYDWKDWLFDRTDENFFLSKTNLRTYLDWLYKELNFKKIEDFYTITGDLIDFHNGRGLTNTYPVYSDAIIKAYPEIKWDITKFGIYKKTQKNLFNIVKELIPNEEVIWEHRDSKRLRFRYSTNAKFEIDIFIPSKKIGIEYQGEQHFRRSWKFNNSPKKFKRLQERDIEKRKICKEEGITLLEVLYTWKGDKKSIVNILNKYFKLR